MQSRVKAWWVPAATGMAGLVAGLFLGGGDENSSLAPTQARAPDTAVVAMQGALTAEDIRRVVREELAAHRSIMPVPAGVNVPAPADAQTVAQSNADLQARSVLETAIARREWAEADADAMRAVFDQLSPGQQSEILRQYAQAVNQGRLVPRTDRIPF